MASQNSLFHAMVVIFALTIALGACASSSSSSDSSSSSSTCSAGSGSGDTMTVNLNSGGDTTYTETAASNELGADPILINSYITGDAEHEIILGCGISGSVIEVLIRFAVSGSMSATSYDLSMSSYSGAYVTNFNTSNDTYELGDDATAGTLNVTSIGSGSVGDTYTGTFNVTSTSPIGSGTAGINTMSGSFTVVRDADDF